MDEPTTLSSIAIIIASIIIFLQNRSQLKKVNDVRSTLTKPNGGSHVKDQLNRIESHLERLDSSTNDQNQRIAYLEGRQDGAN